MRICRNSIISFPRFKMQSNIKYAYLNKVYEASNYVYGVNHKYFDNSNIRNNIILDDKSSFSENNKYLTNLMIQKSKYYIS